MLFYLKFILHILLQKFQSQFNFIKNLQIIIKYYINLFDNNNIVLYFILFYFIIIY